VTPNNPVSALVIYIVFLILMVWFTDWVCISTWCDTRIWIARKRTQHRTHHRRDIMIPRHHSRNYSSPPVWDHSLTTGTGALT
jgi:hypothetical protein